MRRGSRTTIWRATDQAPEVVPNSDVLLFDPHGDPTATNDLVPIAKDEAVDGVERIQAFIERARDAAPPRLSRGPCAA